MSLKKVVVYGGNGALGRTCVSNFIKTGFWVGSIDFSENSEASANLVLDISCSSWTEQETTVVNGVQNILAGDKLDAVICVAGGWAGGNAADKSMVKNADLMWKQSVWTSTIAATLSAQFLKHGGCLTLTGAQPALKGTAGMMGYGMAKAAVHQLTKSLACEKNGLPDGSFVVAILPVTLDTPMNRKFMPKADHSSWTPLEYVAGMFTQWINGEERPKSGSLVQLITKAGQTELIID